MEKSNRDNEFVVILVWSILIAILCFVGSISYSIINEVSHMYARATLWFIGGFIYAILLYTFHYEEEPKDNINKEKKADENTSQ